MQLKIKTLKGNSFNIQTDQSASFLQIKQKINEVRKVPIHLQKIVYKGKVMQNHHLLTEMGVRDEDTFVLMQVVQKKETKSSNLQNVEKLNEREEINNQKKQSQTHDFETKIKHLENMGYTRERSTQALQEKNGNFEEALAALGADEGIQNVQNLIKQEIYKTLQENQSILEQDSQNEGQFSIDLQTLVNNLGVQNEELKNILLNNPNALNQFFMGEGNFDEEQHSEGDQLEQGQSMELTEEEQQSIEKLISLGFEREDVIQVFFACDKDQQIAANMLFERQANGDFDEHLPRLLFLVLNHLILIKTINIDHVGIRSNVDRFPLNEIRRS